jgi:hypothetical protein
MAEFVYVKYRDHILFHHAEPVVLKPQIRETIGWLAYQNEDYIIVCWDRNADSPTLKGGDPQASGLVLLRSDIMELRKIC